MVLETHKLSQEEIQIARDEDRAYPIFDNVENFDMSLPWTGECYSLRDPDNIPRLSYCEEKLELLGRHNSEPKPEYQTRFEEWKTIDYSVNPITRRMHEEMREILGDDLMNEILAKSEELKATKA